jgi:hypothetical protein
VISDIDGNVIKSYPIPYTFDEIKFIEYLIKEEFNDERKDQNYSTRH